MPGLVESRPAYFIEHADGLRTTLLVLNGAVKDYCFAARLEGEPSSSSRPAPTSPTPPAKIEETIRTGAAPFPAERTPIVSGALESCLTSQQQGGKRLETPHLDVAYQAPRESHHARR